MRSMKYDTDNDKVVLIRLAIKDYTEQVSDKVSCVFGWKREEKSCLPWCFGVHLSDALQRLFTSQYQLQEVRDALLNCLDEALYEYKKTKIDTQ